MEIRPRETVVMAVDSKALVAWYIDVLGFVLVDDHEGEYHYYNLETSTGIKVGIANAEEMGVKPVDRTTNTVLMQVEVDDVKAFFTLLEASGGSVMFGPSQSGPDGFWYGGFADPEGNPLWVVDKDCP